jgi:hypothetical protein
MIKHVGRYVGARRVPHYCHGKMSWSRAPLESGRMANAAMATKHSSLVAPDVALAIRNHDAFRLKYYQYTSKRRRVVVIVVR